MILLSTAARTGASQGRAVLLSGTEMWSDTAFLSKGRIFCFRMKFGWECIGYIFFFFSALREVLYKCVFHEYNSSASDPPLERMLVAVGVGNNVKLTKMLSI